jgi:hypothetical protein
MVKVRGLHILAGALPPLSAQLLRGSEASGDSWATRSAPLLPDLLQEHLSGHGDHFSRGRGCLDFLQRGNLDHG